VCRGERRERGAHTREERMGRTERREAFFKEGVFFKERQREHSVCVCVCVCKQSRGKKRQTIEREREREEKRREERDVLSMRSIFRLSS
jgi:type IV secretory pathway VirD2 relaxase